VIGAVVAPEWRPCLGAGISAFGHAGNSQTVTTVGSGSRHRWAAIPPFRSSGAGRCNRFAGPLRLYPGIEVDSSERVDERFRVRRLCPASALSGRIGFCIFGWICRSGDRSDDALYGHASVG